MENFSQHLNRFLIIFKNKRNGGEDGGGKKFNINYLYITSKNCLCLNVSQYATEDIFI